MRSSRYSILKRYGVGSNTELPLLHTQASWFEYGVAVIRYSSDTELPFVRYNTELVRIRSSRYSILKQSRIRYVE
jgi:hypothetical protein